MACSVARPSLRTEHCGQWEGHLHLPGSGSHQHQRTDAVTACGVFTTLGTHLRTRVNRSSVPVLRVPCLWWGDQGQYNHLDCQHALWVWDTGLMERLVTAVHIIPLESWGSVGVLLSRGSCPHPGALPSLWARPFLSCLGCCLAWSPPHVSLALTYLLEKAVTYNSSQRVVTLGVPERCPGLPWGPGCCCDLNNNAHSSTFHAGAGVARTTTPSGPFLILRQRMVPTAAGPPSPQD